MSKRSNKLNGTIQKFDKKQSASDHPETLGMINAVYPDAIQYTARDAGGLRGALLTIGVINFFLMIYVFDLMAHQLYGEKYINFIDYLLALTPPLSLIFGFVMLLWTIRLELFQPIDSPVIFDRKHRRVYRYFPDSKPGFFGLFRKWPNKIWIVSWDLLDAEHVAELTTTGNTVRRNHALLFMLRKSLSDPTPVDGFQIGNSLLYSEVNVAPVWEHIRRYMEENGPALPEGEEVSVSMADKGERALWRWLIKVTPLSKTYWGWWKYDPLLMLFYHAVAPVSFPFAVLWMFFGWLNVMTSRPVKWPSQVKQAIGERVRET